MFAYCYTACLCLTTKCYVGFCTPRRTIMDSKKNKFGVASSEMPQRPGRNNLKLVVLCYHLDSDAPTQPSPLFPLLDKFASSPVVRYSLLCMPAIARRVPVFLLFRSSILTHQNKAMRPSYPLNRFILLSSIPEVCVLCL
jgi:hypothetical protein